MLLFVSTPIGNLEDITIRALKALESAEVLLCEDTRVASKLISLLEQRSLLNPKKREFIPLHSHNEETFLSTLTPDFFDKNIVYLSDAGMPCISDPGSKLIVYLQTNDIKYDFLPGANAATLSFAMSGFEGGFLFVGFLPHTKKERLKILEDTLFLGFNTLFYEAPDRVVQLVEEIALFDEELELFVIKELTKLHQRQFKASAKETATLLKGANLKGEWCVVCKAKAQEKKALTYSELKALNLPPKAVAKIESALSGVSVKELYDKRNKN